MSLPQWHRLLCLASLLFFSISFFTGIAMLRRPTDFRIKSHNVERRARAVKHDRLVFGEVAGKGLPGRLQCEGLIARAGKQGAAPRNESCFLQSNANGLSFVTFFVPPRAENSYSETSDINAIEFGNTTITKLERPYAILTIFVESIQMSNPDSVVTVLTDKVSVVPASKLPVGVHIHRTSNIFDRNNLMLQRLQAYCIFLGELLVKMQDIRNEDSTFQHIIFMDADIIVVDDLRCVFETCADFDIALTFRNNKAQPINSGVIMVRGQIECVSRARSFLMNVVKIYKERFADATRMLGDQLSLAAILLENSNSRNVSLLFKKPAMFMAQISDVQVLFLPSQDYNWTPSEGAGQFHGMPDSVKVLHFKGSRKRLMIEAWNFLKHNNGSVSDMKCLILSSGRAKYDF